MLVLVHLHFRVPKYEKLLDILYFNISIKYYSNIPVAQLLHPPPEGLSLSCHLSNPVLRLLPLESLPSCSLLLHIRPLLLLLHLLHLSVQAHPPMGLLPGRDPPGFLNEMSGR